MKSIDPASKATQNNYEIYDDSESWNIFWFQDTEIYRRFSIL